MTFSGSDNSGDTEKRNVSSEIVVEHAIAIEQEMHQPRINETNNNNCSIISK